jgi:hypothetical protein
MTLEEAWRVVESPRIAAQLGVVSTPRALERALASEPTIRRLLGLLARPHNRRRLYDHFLEILGAPNDQRFAHPLDLALAIYVRLLDIVDPSIAEAAASAALRLPNLWWTRAFAISILAQSARRTKVVRTQQISEPASRTVVTADSSSVPEDAGILAWSPNVATKLNAHTSASVAESALIAIRERVHVSIRGGPG